MGETECSRDASHYDFESEQQLFMLANLSDVSRFGREDEGFMTHEHDGAVSSRPRQLGGPDQPLVCCASLTPKIDTLKRCSVPQCMCTVEISNIYIQQYSQQKDMMT
jgi:hypothetical protein